MAKRKAPESWKLPPPLNMRDDLGDMTAIASGCMFLQDKPLIGTFTVVTSIGHYDFIINEEIANEMVQELREFLRGESADILEE